MNAHPKCSRFISIVLTFCMVVSLLPMSALAARNSAGADARSYEDMPLEVSEEMAASLVSSLTGAPAKSSLPQKRATGLRRLRSGGSV